MGCPPSRKTSKPSGACLGPYEHFPILSSSLLAFHLLSHFLRFSGFLKRNGFDDFPEIRIFRAEIVAVSVVGNPGRAKSHFHADRFSMY
jgi:hypothetical protein